MVADDQGSQVKVQLSDKVGRANDIKKDNLMPTHSLCV